MRSRPLVRLLVARSLVESGSTCDVDVVLTSRSETPTEYVDLLFTAEVAVAIPQGKTVATRRAPITPPQSFRWTPGTLAVGEHRQRVRLTLPPNAPPSYRGGWCRVSYTVEVHVAIPYWIDRHAPFALPVAATPQEAIRGTSALVATHPSGPTAGQMYIEASLDTTQLFFGEELGGEVSFANVKAKRIRRVTVAFVAYEHTREPLRAENVVVRHGATLVSGAPPEGESFPFRFLLSEALWPSFDAKLFAFRWQFEVRADVVLGTDVVLTTPIQVARLAEGANVPPRSRRAVPVGQQRLARLWALVAQRVGPPLSFDAADGSMIGSRGPVAMTIAREVLEGTLGTIATYRFPHLGLDVRLHETGLFDNMPVGFNILARDYRYYPENKRAQKRFTIEGRERAQLAAFFDDALLEHLTSATNVMLDDDAAYVRVPGSASSASTLEQVVRASLQLLGMFEAAVSRIPVPAAMKPHELAWRDFAAQTSGRFEPGRVWVHDATLGGFRFEVGTVWEPHGIQPTGTIVRVPIEPALEHVPSIEDASLSAVAREALRALAAMEGFHASEAEMAFFLRETVPDPARLLGLVENIVSILGALRGSTAAGPFR